MKLLIVDNTEALHRRFNDPLFYAIAQVADYEIANYKEVDEDYINMHRIGGVILSGVPMFYPADVIPERASRLEYIKRSPIPVMGVCLGHQSLGVAYGAEFIEGPEHEIGHVSVQIEPDQLENLLFADIEEPLEVQTMHTCSITLPEGFIQLATSDNCRNQIMQHAENPIYGVQFHPEKSLVGDVLFRNFANIALRHCAQPTEEEILL